jgi:hypothetical protein
LTRWVSGVITAARLLLWSAVYALAVVWGGEWLFDQLASRPFTMGTEVEPRWVRTALAFAPFAAFAIWVVVSGATRVDKAWGWGLLASLAFWGWYYVDGLLNTGGGANIGLGLLMMISPVPVFMVLWLVARKSQAAGSTSSSRK